MLHILVTRVYVLTKGFEDGFVLKSIRASTRNNMSIAAYFIRKFQLVYDSHFFLKVQHTLSNFQWLDSLLLVFIIIGYKTGDFVV